MQIALTRPDGLHILTNATLQQMAKDDTLLAFADGLLFQALNAITLSGKVPQTLAEALHQPDSSQIAALLTALLALDAEVNTVVDDKTRVVPLAGFLSYRSHLSPDKYPLNTLRLPPLNPDGHYIFTSVAEGRYLAVRMDIHPKLQVTGHVRIALGGTTYPPQRMSGIEHRLDRQKLTEDLIEAAITATGQDNSLPLLTEIEKAKLIGVLKGLIGG